MPSNSWPTQNEFYFFGVFLWTFCFILFCYGLFLCLVSLSLVHFDFCCFGVWLFENTKLFEWLGVVRMKEKLGEGKDHDENELDEKIFK